MGKRKFTNVTFYSNIIRSKSYRRRAMLAGREIIDMVEREEDDDHLFDQIERAALSVRPSEITDMISVKD